MMWPVPTPTLGSPREHERQHHERSGSALASRRDADVQINGAMTRRTDRH